jgi:hypothetical protein
VAIAVDSVEQSLKISTQRSKSGNGSSISRNPTTPAGTGYTCSDSALKPRESTALHTALWPIIFERWHLLSLDAPTVAALWAWFFARTMRIDLPWHAPLLLAIGTWLVYVADRILDGTRANPCAPLRERHHFHAQHRKAFLITAVVAGSALIWLIFARMAPNARYEDTVLFAAALLYLVLVHKPRLGGINWLPKELAVGIVFAAATAVPAWSRLNSGIHPGRTALFPAVAIFAALCWLNCIAIERWENLAHAGHLQSPDTHRTTLWVAKHFRLTALSLAAISAAFALASIASNPKTFSLYLAAMTAALCLAAIDHLHQNLSSLHLRVAADAALLTPLMLIPFLR